MKIIKFVFYWLKARFGTLSLEEFCALCDTYEQSSHCRPAKMLLTVYFSSHTPNKDELDRIYASSFELRWLYLENIQRDRQLTEDEEHRLVCYMQMGGSIRFPTRLRESALKELFAQDAPQKISLYACDYALPPEYEMLLIEKCHEQQSEKLEFDDSYRHALLSYLHNHQKGKLLILDVQMTILELNDEELTCALIENCTLTNNILFLPVLQILVEQGSLKALQTLLFRSFLPYETLGQKMLQYFPQLKNAYDISCLRRPLYRLENEVGKFWGTAAPTMEEFQFTQQVIEKDLGNDANGRKKFVESVLLPTLSQNVTPYFCAWIAYKFPELGEQAYQKVREIAKYYHAKYAKKH